MIRDLPTDPLTRLRVRFPREPSAGPCAGVVYASRDGTRDSATRPSGATEWGRAPTEGVGVIADG